jgi:serine/threonine protein kinase
MQEELLRDSARNEAKILKDLNHPRVVKFHDYFEDPSLDQAFLVLEYACAMSLEDLIMK